MSGTMRVAIPAMPLNLSRSQDFARIAVIEIDRMMKAACVGRRRGLDFKSHAPTEGHAAGSERRREATMSQTAAFRLLDPAELRRRVWHIAPGLLPVLLWVVPHRDPLGPTAQAAIFAVALALGGLVFLRYRLIARPCAGVAERAPATAGYVGSVLLPILLFPGDIEIGLTTLAVLAFGDGAATTAGLLLGGRPLPWNRDKSWTGFAAFLLAAVPAATLAHWGESAFNPLSRPASVPLELSFLCGLAAATAGALAESMPLSGNDNGRVGLAAAIAAAAAHFSLVG
jgi:dolichol kinase